MDILGIGPLELVLIILLILIIFGPKEIEKTSKTIGRSLNKLVKSDLWKDIRQTSDKVKNLPNELMREAELEELQKSLHKPLLEEPRILPSHPPVTIDSPPMPEEPTQAEPASTMPNQADPSDE